MNSHWKFALSIFAFIFFMVQLGCIEKTIYPPVVLTVSSVNPYDLQPTADEASSSRTLPTTVVTFRGDTSTPGNIIGFSVKYQTSAGQLLEELTIPFTPLEIPLSPGGDTSVTIAPYTMRVVNLFQRSQSDISPILATMYITIKDANKNTIIMEAHCRLHKPE